MKFAILGGDSKLGGCITATLQQMNHSVLVLRRPTYDLLDKGTVFTAARAAEDFKTDFFILNAYTHHDPMAQAGWFRALQSLNSSLIVIGSYAHYFPASAEMSSGQLAYREAKRELGNIFISLSTRNSSQKVYLLEPGTIRHEGWSVPIGAERTNYLTPFEVIDAMLMLVNSGMKYARLALRGERFP